MTYPEEWDHHPLGQTLETDEAAALRKCTALLFRAAGCLSGLDHYTETVNDINKLHDAVLAKYQALLIPPAP